MFDNVLRGIFAFISYALILPNFLETWTFQPFSISIELENLQSVLRLAKTLSEITQFGILNFDNVSETNMAEFSEFLAPGSVDEVIFDNIKLYDEYL